jgi:hypothetical protein
MNKLGWLAFMFHLKAIVKLRLSMNFPTTTRIGSSRSRLLTPPAMKGEVVHGTGYEASS